MSTDKSRLSRAERRAQLIGAAADAFLTGGYESTSMEDVARTAGVSRLIVYRHFESKADLYQAVLDSVLFDLGRAFATSAFPPGGAVFVLLPVARRHASAFQLLWRHAAHETPFQDRSDLLLARVHDGARAAFAPFITDPVRLNWAARTGGAHLMESICEWLIAGDPELDEEMAVLIRRGLMGLARAWSDVPSADRP